MSKRQSTNAAFLSSRNFNGPKLKGYKKDPKGFKNICFILDQILTEMEELLRISGSPFYTELHGETRKSYFIESRSALKVLRQRLQKAAPYLQKLKTFTDEESKKRYHLYKKQINKLCRVEQHSLRRQFSTITLGEICRTTDFN